MCCEFGSHAMWHCRFRVSQAVRPRLVDARLKELDDCEVLPVPVQRLQVAVTDGPISCSARAPTASTEAIVPGRK